MAVPVIAHRLVLRPEAELERVTPQAARDRCDHGGRGAAVTPTPRAAPCSRSARRRRVAGWRSRPCWPRPRRGRRGRRAACPPAPELEREFPPSSRAAFAARSRSGARRSAVRVWQALPADVTFEPQEGEQRSRGRARRAAPRASRASARGRTRDRAARARSVAPPGGRDADLLVYPDLVGARRLALAARRGRCRSRAPREGVIRARHRVRSGARVRARRRRAADQLARDGTARPPDVQPVPHRPGPGGALPASTPGASALPPVPAARCSTSRSTASSRSARPPMRLAIAAARWRSPIAMLRDVAPSRLGAAAVARALFDVEPVDTDSDYELAFRSVGGRQARFRARARRPRRRGCGARPDRRRAVLARRHAVCVASVRDAALDGLLARPPADLRDAYAMTVALEMRRARARRRAACRDRRRHGRRSASRGLCGRMRQRVRRGRRRAAERDDRAPSRARRGRARAGARPRSSTCRDEALDEPGEDEPRHRPEHDADRAPGLGCAAPRRACRRPGSTSDQPTRSPAAAVTAMHESSSTPWPTTSRSRSPPLPAPAASPATAPSRMPLVAST